MAGKRRELILLLFAIVLVSFISGCASTQKINEIAITDSAMMIPPEMKCCNEYNSTYNRSEGNYETCCSLTEFPDACSECVVNETQRRAEYINNRQRYNRISPLEIFLRVLPVVLLILLLLSVLLLISDKIAEIAKDGKEGFLGHRFKRILQVFVLAAVGVFIIFSVLIFFTPVRLL